MKSSAVTGGAFCFMLMECSLTAIKGLIMANEEQLAILKQGVEVWNKWRDRIIQTIQIDLT